EAEQAPVVVAHPGDDHARPEGRAVLAHAPALLLEAAGGRALELAARAALRAGVVRIELREVPADDLVRRIAEDALGAGVPARHVAVVVEHEDGVVDDAFHHQPEAPLALRKRAFGAHLP